MESISQEQQRFSNWEDMEVKKIFDAIGDMSGNMNSVDGSTGQYKAINGQRSPEGFQSEPKGGQYGPKSNISTKRIQTFKWKDEKRFASMSGKVENTQTN